MDLMLDGRRIGPALAAFALGMVTLALASTDAIVVLAAVLIGFGYAGMYLLLAAVVLCGAAIYYVVHGRGERMTLAA